MAKSSDSLLSMPVLLRFAWEVQMPVSVVTACGTRVLQSFGKAAAKADARTAKLVFEDVTFALRSELDGRHRLFSAAQPGLAHDRYWS